LARHQGGLIVESGAIVADETHPFPPWEEFSSAIERGYGQVFASPDGNVRLGLHPVEGLGQVMQRGRHQLPGTHGRANLASQHITHEGQTWTLLNVLNLVHNELEDAYGLLDLVGRSIVQGTSIAAATAESLQVMGHLLERDRTSSVESEIGLLAELLFLQAAMALHGPEQALAGWIGPVGGNHDFEYSSRSFEVKATRSAKRQHRVSSDHQLETVPGSELRLASFQFVLSGSDEDLQVGLVVQRLATLYPQVADPLNTKLARIGWSNERLMTSTNTWKLASEPREFIVDSSFPHLTRDHITEACPAPDRIKDITYTISLEGLPANAPVVIDAIAIGGIA